MDATKANNSPGQASRSDPAPAHPPLPGWLPPVYGVLCGIGVALQAPSDAKPGLLAPFIGLALVLGAYALLRGIRARLGVPQRRPARSTWVPVVVFVPALQYYAQNSTADLRWLYIALGVVIAGALWYRLQKGPRQ